MHERKANVAVEYQLNLADNNQVVIRAAVPVMNSVGAEQVPATQHRRVVTRKEYDRAST